MNLLTGHFRWTRSAASCAETVAVDFDAVVVGGGPAGAAATSTLAREKLRVLGVESLATVPFKVGETLPPSATPLLQALGVAPAELRRISVPCPGNVSLWGGPEAQEVPFIRGVYGCGWHLDRPRFDALLRKEAREAGASFWPACRLTEWSFDGSLQLWNLVFLSQGRTKRVSTRWLLDATGRRALVATRCGAPSIIRDRLVAFCLVAKATPSDLDGRTWIESAEEGWWYTALLPGARRMFAFFTDSDLPAAAASRYVDGFLKRLGLTQRMKGWTPKTGTGRIRRFPAYSASRAAFGGEGWLAIGDASLAFDPLSSQGIFHALYTGLRGAETVAAAMGGNRAALPAWNARLRSIESAYQKNLDAWYEGEKRWPASEFWKRRQTDCRLREKAGVEFERRGQGAPMNATSVDFEAAKALAL